MIIERLPLLQNMVSPMHIQEALMTEGKGCWRKSGGVVGGIRREGIWGRLFDPNTLYAGMSIKEDGFNSQRIEGFVSFPF